MSTFGNAWQARRARVSCEPRRMSRRRHYAFAAPLVVIAFAPACDKSSSSSEPNKPKPSPDAEMTRKPKK